MKTKLHECFMIKPLFSLAKYLSGAITIISFITTGMSAETLNIDVNAGNVVLSWTNSAFALQSSPSATGVFTNVPGATSPYTNTITGSQMFFRLQSSAPSGIYMGTISGTESSGDFAMMVKSNGQGIVAMGYDTIQASGFLVTGYQVAGDGSFTFVTSGGATVSGTVSADTVSGTFTNENSAGINGTFNGTIKPITGIQQANAGYYTGTFGGAESGSIYSLLAADGKVFLYTLSSTGGDDAGTGTINAENSVSATSFGGTTITGTLNPTTHVITGSYSSGGTTLGTFSLSLNSSP
jgi:hypothetical protein